MSTKLAPKAKPPIWVTFVVVLVGAELNAELEHQTSEIQQREGGTRI
jgi:uncharacterized BrkB/YihY/UPF0761 family membrane protein